MRAENQPLPPDTRINVRYGANHEGEPYTLGEPSTPQAVRCTEDSSPGGAPSVEADSSANGGAGSGSEDVWALRCLLYTQGPADVDVTATGMEPLSEALSQDRKHRCDIKIYLTLKPEKPDAGM